MKIKDFLRLFGFLIILTLSGCGEGLSASANNNPTIIPTTVSVINTSSPPISPSIATSSAVMVSTPTTVITGANKGLMQIALAPNAHIFASVGNSGDGVTKLWNGSGQLIANLVGKADAKSAIDNAIGNVAAWSPDGKILASSADSQEIWFWDANGKLITTLTGHSAKVGSLAWSPDGKILASGGIDKNIILWDNTGKQLAILSGHTGPIGGLAWSSNNILASIGGGYISGSQEIEDNTLRLWDAKGKLIANITNPKSKHSYLSLAWSSDGQVLIAGAESTLDWYSTDGKLLKNLPGGGEAVTSIRWSPDNTLLAAGDEAGNISVWKTDGTLVATLDATNIVGSIAWSHDGKILAGGDSNGLIILWNSATKQTTTLKNLIGSRGVTTLAWTADDQTLISGFYNGTIAFWN
jgi:WD40 repeat protein